MHIVIALLSWPPKVVPGAMEGFSSHAGEQMMTSPV